MIAINIAAEQAEQVPQWRAQHGYTIPVVLSDSEFVQATYGVTVAPTTVLLNSDRKLVFSHRGVTAGPPSFGVDELDTTLEEEIRELLGLGRVGS